MKKEKFEYLLKNSNNPEELKKFTRRELLQAGLLTFAAQMLLPTAGSLFAPLSANAESLQTDWSAFLTINLEGGASLHGNLVALNQGGDLLSRYTFHGLGTQPSTEKYLGLTFDSRSRILAGIKSVLSDSAAAKSRGAVLCTNTASDTRGIMPLRPQFDLSAVIEKNGRSGQFFSSLEFQGNDTSLRSFHDGAPISRLQVSALSQVLDSLTMTSTFASKVGTKDRFSKSQKSNLTRMLASLTETQLAQSQKAGAEAYVSASQVVPSLVAGDVSGRDLVDPMKVQKLVDVYGLAASTATDATKTKASVTYSAIMGYSSSSLIRLGGYDYHDPQVRTGSDNLDFNAGVEIGRALEIAHRLGKPIFIFVATDGSNFSVESETNSSNWSADTSSAMQLMLAYHPSGMETIGTGLVGYYNEDQKVEKNTLVGDRSDYVGAAVMANYLAMHGRQADLTKVAPATITSDKIDQVVRIAKKA